MRTFFLGVAAIFAFTTVAMAQNPPVRLTQLHDALHLTAPQEAAWRDYQRAVSPDPTALARRQSAQELMTRIPTPRRIALLQATMNEDLDDFRRQGAAVIDFYNRLTPEQQRIFDRQTAPSTGG